VAAHRCLRCGSSHLRRSHRKNAVERFLLPLLLIRPYRCQECKLRQYGFGFHRARSQAVNTFLAVVFLASVLAGLIGVGYLLLAIVARL